MVKNLVNKSEFARTAGVSVAAITKATKRGSLQAAMHGAKINASHPTALDYLGAKQQKEHSDHTGMDPRYEEAVEFCKASGRWTATAISNGLEGVGRARAKKIFCVIKAAGIVPAKGESSKLAIAPAQQVTHAKPSGKQALRIAKKESQIPTFDEDMWEKIPEDIRKLGNKTLRALVDIFGTDNRFVDWLNATKKIEDIYTVRLKNSREEGQLVHVDLIRIGIIDPIDAAHRLMLADASITIARRLSKKFKAGASVEDAEEYIQRELSKHMRPMKDKITNTLREI